MTGIRCTSKKLGNLIISSFQTEPQNIDLFDRRTEPSIMDHLNAIKIGKGLNNLEIQNLPD